MSKSEVEYTDYLKETWRRIGTPGGLLVSLDEAGRPNAMTIGWGTVGIVWGRPMFTVLVRPSRYTYSCIETTGDFTVNVPTMEMAEAAAFCGSASGRDYDKFAEKGLTAVDGLTVKSPIIGECPLGYECKVVHTNDVLAGTLAHPILSGYYPEGDYHRVYYGQILAVRADEDAREKLAD